MTPDDCVALALAVLALERAWFEGGSPSARLERARAWRGLRGRKAPLSFLGHVLTCPVCLPFHLAFWLAALVVLPCYWLPGPWPAVLRTLLRLLAVVGLVHLLWDLHGPPQIDNTRRPLDQA